MILLSGRVQYCVPVNNRKIRHRSALEVMQQKYEPCPLDTAPRSLRKMLVKRREKDNVTPQTASAHRLPFICLLINYPACITSRGSAIVWSSLTLTCDAMCRPPKTRRPNIWAAQRQPLAFLFKRLCSLYVPTARNSTATLWGLPSDHILCFACLSPAVYFSCLYGACEKVSGFVGIQEVGS